MAGVHSVEISWEDLLSAFTNGEADRIYFLDRFTGEIFSISDFENDAEFQSQLDKNSGRFLEIPLFDYHTERQIMAGFISSIADSGLKNLLSASLAGKKPYGKTEDILSFYPEEEERLLLLKDQFLSSRLKVWLEENNLFTVDRTTQGLTRP